MFIFMKWKSWILILDFGFEFLNWRKNSIYALTFRFSSVMLKFGIATVESTVCLIHAMNAR